MENGEVAGSNSNRDGAGNGTEEAGSDSNAKNNKKRPPKTLTYN
jgi:hypothetical protein